MKTRLEDRLKEARVASGFTRVKHAADAAGITPSALYQLENGTTKSLSGDTAEKLGRIYPGFRVEWLISGTGVAASGRQVGEAPASYSASHALRIDPDTIASALRLIRLSFENLDVDFDSEEDGVPLAFAYEYLHIRGERTVTPDNLVDFSKKLAERLREKNDAGSSESGSNDAGSVGRGDRSQSPKRKAG